MPGSREEDFLRNNAYSQYDLYGRTEVQKALPRGHEIYNFGRPFLVHHYIILSLLDLCLGEGKKIFKEIIFTIYKLVWPHPRARTPAQGVIKFTILVDPSLVISTLYLVCLIFAWEKRRRFLKEIMHIHSMTYIATP